MRIAREHARFHEANDPELVLWCRLGSITAMAARCSLTAMHWTSATAMTWLTLMARW